MKTKNISITTLGIFLCSLGISTLSYAGFVECGRVKAVFGCGLKNPTHAQCTDNPMYATIIEINYTNNPTSLYINQHGKGERDFDFDISLPDANTLKEGATVCVAHNGDRVVTEIKIKGNL